MYFDESDLKIITSYINLNFELKERFKIIKSQKCSKYRYHNKSLCFVIDSTDNKVVLENKSRKECLKFIDQQPSQKILKKKEQIKMPARTFSAGTIFLPIKHS